MMNHLAINLIFDVLQNTLHLEGCTARSKDIKGVSKYFLKPQTQSEAEFLFSTVSHLIKAENNLTFEICPHCLGEKYDFLSPEFYLKIDRYPR
ncbi:MAG: hypothetical protein ACRC51_04165 [Cetobacterium sp.]